MPSLISHLDFHLPSLKITQQGCIKFSSQYLQRNDIQHYTQNRNYTQRQRVKWINPVVPLGSIIFGTPKLSSAMVKTFDKFCSSDIACVKSTKSGLKTQNEKMFKCNHSYVATSFSGSLYINEKTIHLFKIYSK